MKCKFCNGSGKDYWCLNGVPYPCPVCNGTGEYEPFDADVELDKLYPTEQTNEEWFCLLPTEEKAKFFHGIVIRAMQATWDGKKPDYPAYLLYDWKKWLKQPHTEKE